MKIPPEAWATIATERKKRDHAAFMIGIATHEWRELVRKSESLIAESEARETDLGKTALRACGVDPDAEEYGIMADGEIVRLANGTYLTMEGTVYDGL